jgi:hypothetical protein
VLGGGEGVALDLDVGEADRPEPGRQGPGEGRVGQVAVPGAQDPVHVGGVEGGVGDRQSGRIGEVQAHVAGAVGAAPGQGQGLGAGVDPGHRPGRPHLLEQLGKVEAGAATDVQDPLTGPGPQGLADQPAAAQDVAGPVELLELGGEAVVEDELAHGVLPCRVGCPRGAGRSPPVGARAPPDPARTRPAAQVSQVTGSAAT